MAVSILIGDVREKLAELADESVHCVVTSPPYWGLRDYGVEGQLGLEPTIELYVQHMVEVFREVRRVLRKDGTLWLNMGDCYAGSWGAQSRDGSETGLSAQQIQAHPKGQTHVGSLSRTPGLKRKDLVGQPWRVAFALQADGWWLRSDIVWAKPNPMPESCRDRPTKSHEYVFMLTKSGASTFWTHRDKAGTCTSPEPDYIWIDRAAEYLHANMAELWGEPLAAGFKALGFTPNLSAASGLIEHREEPERWKTERFPRLPKSWPAAPHEKRWKRLNLWTGHDYFFDQEAVREGCESGASDVRKMIQARERIGGKHKTLDDPLNKASKHTNIGRKRSVGDPSGRNIRSVWTIPTQPFPEAHFATFPETLPERCIRAGTSERGCCPQCGAPWVRVVELNPDYKKAVPDGWTLAPTNWDTEDGAHQMEKRDRSATRRMAKGAHPATLPQKNITTGWRPSCKHKGAPIPCTVLDPFMGSGTTALVALKLTRRAIGIELNAEYAEMARRRLEREVPLLMGAL